MKLNALIYLPYQNIEKYTIHYTEFTATLIEK